MQKMAYFDSSHDMPEEIVMAAGFTPYKILGDVNVPNDAADQYLQNFLCPAARSFLTEALDKEKSKDWAGIVVAHGCDATNRFYDIWKMHVDTKFMYWFNTPMNDTKTAAKFFKKELQAMIDRFEKEFDVKITNEKLKEAIALSNEIKGKMRKLATLRAQKDIPNRDYFHMCVKGLTMDRDALLEELDSMLDDWSSRESFPAGMKKILLTGSDITYVQWFDMLEEAGLRVVRDDLSIGERYFATSIPDLEDPLDAIVQYHFNIPRPATKNPPDPRLDFLLKALEETKIDIVVSQNLKFCEPFAFDSVHTVAALKERGFKVIHLEREFTPTMDVQNLNRLEAFLEM